MKAGMSPADTLDDAMELLKRIVERVTLPAELLATYYDILDDWMDEDSTEEGGNLKMDENQCYAQRPKYWSEIGIEEKVERMRGVVKPLYDRPMGYCANEIGRKPENDKEVYF